MDFVISKIAFRNLKQHKSKTLIIGSLVAISVAILIIGSSFLNTLSVGIENNYVNKYTGSIFIAPSANTKPSLIVPSFSSGKSSIIDNFSTIEAAVNNVNGIKDTTGQINSIGLIKYGENGTGMGILKGVDPADYNTMFPDGVNIVEGSFLKSGEEGIVVSQYVMDIMKASSNEEINIGDKIMLTSINDTSGTKIREVTLRGIHEFDDDSMDIKMVCFVDLDDIRALNGILLNDETTLDLNAMEKEDLGIFDEDSLFSDSSNNLFADDESIDNTNKSEDFNNILGDTSDRDSLNVLNTDAYSYMLVKLDNPNSSKKMISTLNNLFEENDWDLTAYDWSEGAGMSAQMAKVFATIFYAILSIIAVVVIVVIMNTLVVSISERTGEIGTMRAIGAKKSFVRKMISLETAYITLVFGAVGCILGVGILAILEKVGIHANGMFMKILLGGDVFVPIISGKAIILSIVIISIISILASLYPVALALRISPRKAMDSR